MFLEVEDDEYICALEVAIFCHYDHIEAVAEMGKCKHYGEESVCEREEGGRGSKEEDA